MADLYHIHAILLIEVAEWNERERVRARMETERKRSRRQCQGKRVVFEGKSWYHRT